jgi:hypothetical protein
LALSLLFSSLRETSFDYREEICESNFNLSSSRVSMRYYSSWMVLLLLLLLLYGSLSAYLLGQSSIMRSLVEVLWAVVAMGGIS